jgi:large subunit ribosomal protein L6
MTMSDPLADMLTRIRNGQRARQAVVAAPASKFRANVLEVLKREGYIRGFTQEQVRPGISELKIELKYVDGEPVIREISRVSKPGRRIYSSLSDLPRVYNGLGISILSTPRGVMSDNEARAAKGKNPVAIPEGVSVEFSGQTLTAKGRLGTLSLVVSNEVAATVADGNVTVEPKDESKRARAMWGTTRALVNNMVTGVATGFTRNLEINGVGYRASVQGNSLNLQLGYSHDINYPIPADVKIVCERPTVIAISGADRQRVGQVAAEIRSFRPPEPYKGKGIKYSDETIRRKEGKKK